MKFALVTLFALLAVAHARVLDQVDLEDLTAYDYLAKYGLPLAEEIRKAEEEDRSRIVGGSLAAEGQFPYQAGLLAQFSQGQGVCGGSLISVGRVVTAAHCWWDGVNQASSLTVVLGSNLLFSGGTRISTNQVVLHAQWTPSLARNDIAIIGLPSNVGLSSAIGIIALPSGFQLNDNFVGDNAVASGFGLTSDGGSITTGQGLSQVELPVIANNVCSRSFPFIIQPSHICTSGANGRSTCSGDSGGPLTVQRGAQRILVGVISFGSNSGCQLGHPAVYARVTSFMTFINQNL